jgi:hypothetical protein
LTILNENKSEIGNSNAATVANQLLNDFGSIRFGLLVGIGSGILLADPVDALERLAGGGRYNEFLIYPVSVLPPASNESKDLPLVSR